MNDARKWAIITDFRATGSISKTSRNLQTSRETVSRWVKRYEASGTVGNKKKSGRRPTISGGAAERALALLTDGSQNSAGQAASLLRSEGLTAHTVHRTTVIRSVKALAISKGTPIRSVSTLPAKRLNNATKAKRLRFAQLNITRRWGNVMFTDRKKFQFYFPGVPVKDKEWVLLGQQRQATRVNHASVVNIYAGITKWGVTKCHVVAGTTKHKSTYKNKKGDPSRNITSSEYTDVVEKTFLPEGKRLFSTQGIASWVLQQDNDPTHRVAADVVSKWNEKNSSSIALLPNWPPSSPDLSPIENLWAWVQRRVNEKGCKSFQDFEATVMSEMKNVPQKVLLAYFDSMRKRMEKTIALEGDKTGY